MGAPPRLGDRGRGERSGPRRRRRVHGARRPAQLAGPTVARQLRGVAKAASWTAASTEWLKVLARRKRPVLYTSDAITAAADPESQQSLPSLHASLAFAAATSYFLIARRQHLPDRMRNTILLYSGRVGLSA